MSAILGGSLSPLGWSAGFLEAPLEAVRERLVAWRRELGADLTVTDVPTAWPECALGLDPLETPWTTELLVGHGERWTAYLNNQIDGGDPWPATHMVSGLLGVRWVVATCQPMISAGHASTQLWLGGPEGEPPLNYIRTIAAHAEDRRWSWHTSGTVQPFEQTDAYRARKIRERFTRDMLVTYLAALGIHADDDQQYGRAVLVRRHPTWRRRTVTLEEARRQRDR